MPSRLLIVITRPLLNVLFQFILSSTNNNKSQFKFALSKFKLFAYKSRTISGCKIVYFIVQDTDAILETVRCYGDKIGTVLCTCDMVKKNDKFKLKLH